MAILLKVRHRASIHDGLGWIDPMHISIRNANTSHRHCGTSSYGYRPILILRCCTVEYGASARDRPTLDSRVGAH